jgi:hypothetical protein
MLWRRENLCCFRESNLSFPVVHTHTRSQQNKYWVDPTCSHVCRFVGCGVVWKPEGERGHLEDIDVYRRIILKWILNTLVSSLNGIKYDVIVLVAISEHTNIKYGKQTRNERRDDWVPRWRLRPPYWHRYTYRHAARFRAHLPRSQSVRHEGLISCVYSANGLYVTSFPLSPLDGISSRAWRLLWECWCLQVWSWKE